MSEQRFQVVYQAPAYFIVNVDAVDKDAAMEKADQLFNEYFTSQLCGSCQYPAMNGFLDRGPVTVELPEEMELDRVYDGDSKTVWSIDGDITPG